MTLFRYRVEMYFPGRVFLTVTIFISLLMWWLGLTSPHMAKADVARGMIPFSIGFIGMFGILPCLAPYLAFPEIYISDEGIGGKRFGMIDNPIKWTDIKIVEKTKYLDRLSSQDRVEYWVKSDLKTLRFTEQIESISKLKSEITARRSVAGFKLVESDKPRFRTWSIESL